MGYALANHCAQRQHHIISVELAINAEEIGRFNFAPNFFENFTSQRGNGRFCVFNASARRGPKSVGIGLTDEEYTSGRIID